MRISILIPVYNEQNTISEIIQKVSLLKIEKEIIVIDDGSKDDTPQILKRLLADNKEIKTVFHSKNKGKGAAIRSGLKKATGEYVIIQDADLELDPLDIIKLVDAVSDRCGVVYGSRFLSNQRVPLLSYVANRFLTFLTNFFYGSNLTDMETCYKLVKKEILLSLNLKSRRFEIEPEITCKILKRGYKIKEIPISYTPRKEGKKIGWIDGFKAIYTILKFRIYD
ncbi:MAG: glycosyltransferase family 2 protein [Candidatus Omnitrophica bacterium]|nr:glycosyltransferase family 2 protein [Candidatus Omnitrophota bacterium]